MSEEFMGDKGRERTLPEEIVGIIDEIERMQNRFKYLKEVNSSLAVTFPDFLETTSDLAVFLTEYLGGGMDPNHFQQYQKAKQAFLILKKIIDSYYSSVVN
jgi:hypothetical protein